MKDKAKKPITEDAFTKFLITLCYVFMAIGMIVSIAIGVTTQELVSSLASMVILTMFVLLIIFVTIVLFAYSVEFKRREEEREEEYIE